MKILALDLGDKWTGIAISDALGMLARPLKTIEAKTIMKALGELLTQERISTVVVGLPKTMKGTDSDQTQKVREQFESFKTKFSQTTWVLWDERLTSKQATSLRISQGKKGTVEHKHQEHAVAAAFILQGYLDLTSSKTND